MPADRFSRLEKVAIFLIALGEERTREILDDVDLDTVERLNAAIVGLGQVSVKEKASVMLEFAHFFYEDMPISGKPEKGLPQPGKSKRPNTGDPAGRRKPPPQPAVPDEESQITLPNLPLSTDEPPAAQKVDDKKSVAAQSDEEKAILNTLDKLRQRLDPGKIDWGKAGYDFGDGFKGPADSDRV